MKTIDIQAGADIAKDSFGLGQEHLVVILDQVQNRDDAAVHFDMHYELEMGVIIEGSMERYTRDSSRVCRAGEMWFTGIVSAGNTTTARRSPTGRLEGVNNSFSQEIPQPQHILAASKALALRLHRL